MISAEALALAPAVTGLGSWLADIGERLMRGVLAADEALAEMRQHQAEADAEIAQALAGIKSDRAEVDELIERMPSAAAPPPAAPAPPPAAEPGAAPVVPAVVAPRATGEE